MEFKSPAYHVIPVPVEKIKPNTYNPNAVAPPEMKLLYESIKADGYTMPIVCYYAKAQDEYIIVDGFHRYRVITEHPDIDGIISGLEKGDVRAVASSMGNVLEGVTIPMHPVIAEIKKEMMDAGALGAMMSGSGPTVFGLFDNRAAAKSAQKKIREKALTKQVYVTNIHSVRRK